LETMGDIDRQSIAGATQTGTHGTGHAFTGLAGTVRALKLALADGSIVSCSADRNPELFHAARLSLGTLGVVLEVTIQAVPRYALAMTETTAPIEETASAFLHTSTEADHQEFFHFLGTDRATVRTTSRVPADTPVTRRSAPVELLHRELLGNGAFELMCRAAVLIPPLSGPVAEVASRAFAGPPVTDDSARVYVAPRRVRFHESEWALPAEHFEEAFAALRRRIREERIRVTFPVEVRRVAADDVWLSTAYGRDTVYIAAHRYHRERPDPYLLLVQRTLEPFAARPHWGKKHWLDAPALRDLYPRFEDHAAVRRTADPGGLFMTPYLRHILGP
ncbi:MAG: D-arabinono-1,4-lactone oxidase, partial [Brachybacterium sp.]|nr:D-arabinono-1,4-lactone oxidase [Brachybacterium sp.]